MRSVLATLLTGFSLTLMIAVVHPADAQPLPGPEVCNYPDCTPGVSSHIVLGSNCNSTTYYVFGVTDWGRLVFCGSPRRYEQRWFRSPQMRGVKNLGDSCTTQEGQVAQAPDGLFLSCVVHDGRAAWERGDL